MIIFQRQSFRKCISLICLACWRKDWFWPVHLFSEFHFKKSNQEKYSCNKWIIGAPRIFLGAPRIFFLCTENFFLVHREKISCLKFWPKAWKRKKSAQSFDQKREKERKLLTWRIKCVKNGTIWGKCPLLAILHAQTTNKNERGNYGQCSGHATNFTAFYWKSWHHFRLNVWRTLWQCECKSKECQPN